MDGPHQIGNERFLLWRASIPGGNGGVAARDLALFSMGGIREVVKDGGELVLETLVIPGSGDEALVPEDRYAGMKNVWSVPTVPRLVRWMEQAGLNHISVLDQSRTTLGEQRQTRWMTSYSLNQFLDPRDPGLTIEGYPAPVRVMIKCAT